MPRHQTRPPAGQRPVPGRPKSGRPKSGRPSPSHKAAEVSGRIAEAIAAFVLRLSGYRILARRWRCSAGELGRALLGGAAWPLSSRSYHFLACFVGKVRDLGGDAGAGAALEGPGSAGGSRFRRRAGRQPGRQAGRQAGWASSRPDANSQRKHRQRKQIVSAIQRGKKIL